ncbi:MULTISPECIES: class I SAM-dependent methyltransferase [Streptomyces]|jgi:SAM-dependent methyltransferase|uniref:class I SAM-dependent methyltransferase n=1 Tax=Streptomyces TaxID=1883 RepID=UPI0004C0542B|nr:MULTISPECIES: class I SAM-dependent methyltransferase [Streptomyces]WSQ21751.1 class I SAM-dependent methyltransferase [Streptomyces zaomyceticus]
MADTAAWNTYSHQNPGRRHVNASGATTWFNWTQYADHGPGAEILDLAPASVVLELGCGKGGNLAHVATLGHRAIGLDISPPQLAAAAERWGELPGLELHNAEAVAYLEETDEKLDAVFSVFGAAWFTAPEALLPAVRARLRPGGVFAFSHRPAIEGCYGCQASYINRSEDEDPLVVKRWDYEPEAWEALLAKHGFTSTAASLIAAPPGPRKMGTLLVEARA